MNNNIYETYLELTKMYKNIINALNKECAHDDIKAAYLTGKLDAIEEISQFLLEYLSKNN